MTVQELNSYTVLELRKLARSLGVVLGAGVTKSDIVQKISDATADQPEAASVSAPAKPVEATQPESVQTDIPVKPAPAQPKFSSKPAYQATPAWQSNTQNTSTPMRDTLQKPVAPRPAGYTPRFGPGVAAQPAAQEKPVVPVRPVAHVPERRFGPGSAPAATPAFGPGSVSRNVPVTPVVRPVQEAPKPAVQETPYVPPLPKELGIEAPTLEELLENGDYLEGEGTLELHPDGYGFLRTTSLLPSSEDIYISVAQVRRFALRTGDVVAGKIRPRKETDKYNALLYVTSINGIPADETDGRLSFEELTVIPSDRKIDLQPHGTKRDHIRLLDLITPIGFGQKALMLCPPGTGKTDLLRDMVLTLTENHPEAEVILLLIDMDPAEAEALKKSVTCSVLCSTSDQAPESHLRLTDMVLERAMRLVERRKDVIVLADSLTRLAKVYSTAAANQGRVLPGMVNPTSLFRAKRLFNAARCIQEGGSLTMIAAMDISTGSKVDDSVVEEFKTGDNVELVLDGAMAAAGIKPPLNLALSASKNADQLLPADQMEGLRCIRSMVAPVRSEQAIPQLAFFLDKAETNSELLLKMRDWFAMMSGK